MIKGTNAYHGRCIVPTEVRYIIFSRDEVRSAIISFVQKQRQAATAADVLSVELVDSGPSPTALVRLQSSPPGDPLKLNDQYLIAALLLFCFEHRIPVPKLAAKRTELTINGLTLVKTSDRTSGSPVVASEHIAYGELATRATQKLGNIEEHLARALARAEHAEGLVAASEERARRAEAARGRSSAILTAVALVPGLRGHIGRYLVKFRLPFSDQPV